MCIFFSIDLLWIVKCSSKFQNKSLSEADVFPAIKRTGWIVLIITGLLTILHFISETLCLHLCTCIWSAFGPVIMFALVSLMTDACSITQWWETQQRTGIFEDAFKRGDLGASETVWRGFILNSTSPKVNFKSEDGFSGCFYWVTLEPQHVFMCSLHILIVNGLIKSIN